MKKLLKLLIEPRLPGIIIPLIIGGIIWYFPKENPQSISIWTTENTPLSTYLNQFILPFPELRETIGFLFVLLTSILLILINQKYSLIRIRTFIPFFFLIFLVGSNLYMHQFDFSYTSSLMMIIILWQLFSIYEKREPIAALFNIGMFLGAGSLLAMELVLFIPYIFIGIQRLKGFSLKSLFAFILGILTPYMLLLGYMFVFNGDITNYISQLFTHFTFTIKLNLDSKTIIFIALSLLITLIGIVNIMSNTFNDKIRVSKMLGVISFGYIYSSILLVIKGDSFSTLFYICTIFSSIILAHFYTLTNRLFSRIIFGIQFVLNIGFIIVTSYFIS